MLGDIIVSPGGAYVVCDQPMAAYIEQNLTQIGREAVTVESVDSMGQAAERRYRRETVTVAALRLDAVLSKAFRISREAAATLIKKGDVKLDFRPVSSPIPVEDGMLLSCRGQGRVKILSTGGLTRKGRIPVELGFPL